MMVSRTKQWLLTSGLALAAAAAAAGGPTLAQQTTAPRALTAGDYARAEQYMAYNPTPLLLRSGVRPTWLPDGRFWYRISTEKGTEAFIVDPVKPAKAPCDLPACTAGGGRGGAPDPPEGGGGRGAVRNDVPSPDAKRSVFIRDWTSGSATSRPAGKPR